MPTIATLTATLPVANRVGIALGKFLGLKDGQGVVRQATIPEYEDWLRDATRRMVMEVERIEAANVIPPPADVIIT